MSIHDAHEKLSLSKVTKINHCPFFKNLSGQLPKNSFPAYKQLSMCRGVRNILLQCHDSLNMDIFSV